MKFSKLLVIIPTRNRAEFAIRAINSVLGQEGASFDVLVSDNSTDEQESNTLSSFCEKLGDPRLKYIRPEDPLPMAKHWDWVMDHAVTELSFSHVVFLTDRMVFLRDSLRRVTEILTDYPDAVVSYNTDYIDDTSSPVSLLQSLRTEGLFELNSARILDAFANSKSIRALPRTLNCAVPRHLMVEIKQKTGRYFSSIAPDFNFAFNCLKELDTVLYYDDTLLLGYGLNRSNGLNLLSGTLQKDSLDFIQNLDNTEVCFETPVKSLFVRTNVVMHEYCFVKGSGKPNGKFPELGRRNYLISLATDIVSYGNSQQKEEMWDKLRSELGWRSRFYAMYGRAAVRIEGLTVRLFNLLNRSNPHTKITHFPEIDRAVEYANSNRRDIDRDSRFLRQRIGDTLAKKHSN